MRTRFSSEQMHRKNGSDSYDSKVRAYGRNVAYSKSESYFDIWHEVPLLGQHTGMSCWAAAAAMIVGWRESINVEATDVVNGLGYWHAYQSGLRPKDTEELCKHWGLIPVKENIHSVEQMATLLKRYGPLWLGEAVPGLHVVVVTGMYGDGTRRGTMVRVNDSWPVDRGERYSISFKELADNINAARCIAGAHVQLLHCGGRSKGARGSSFQMNRKLRSSVRISTDLSRKDRFYKTQQPAGGYGRSPSVGWAKDSNCIDYRHIDKRIDNTPFRFTAEQLARLCELNAFDVSAYPLVLFGLRGCRIVGPTNTHFRREIQIAEMTPDHIHPACVLGVWDKKRCAIAVFTGSTIPAALGVLNRIQKSSEDKRHLSDVNLLPTGRYLYSVGDLRGKQHIPRVFLQHGPVVVLRTYNDPVYTVHDNFCLRGPIDHIIPSLGFRRYCSAGSSVICGSYRHGEHQGPWEDFRTASQFDKTPDGRYPYILLTGRDARLGTSESYRPKLYRLRFGSSGPLVAALQNGLCRNGFLKRTARDGFLLVDEFRDRPTVQIGRLPGDAAGYMRGNTTIAYIMWQRLMDSSGAADGVVSPKTADMLGVPLPHSRSR